MPKNAPEHVLDEFQPNLDAGYLPAGNLSGLWQASYAPVRRTQAFRDLMRKAGLVHYGRARLAGFVSCHHRRRFRVSVR